MTDAPSTPGDTATVTRVFDAPRERIWTCLTEAEHFAQWFGTPPFTTPASTITMDVQPGGEFRATMVHETDGTEAPFVGHFRARWSTLSGWCRASRTLPNRPTPTSRC